MLKYLFLLFPLFGQSQVVSGYPPVMDFVYRVNPVDVNIIDAEPITSYTTAQTGSGNAEVYWPEGATHVVIFIPGSGERSTPAQLYTYNSPINWVKNGARPKYAVVAFSPGPYTFVSVNNASYLKVIKFLKWLRAVHPEVKTFSPTGLSYGAADWYNYIKFASEADYWAPYSAVLMSITSEAQCSNYTQLCGTDLRFKDIKLWAMCARNDSHHDKQKRYTDLMIAAGYPAKWESTPATEPKHCCWNLQYGRQDVKDWLSGPVETAPPITISAGPDITITFPVDSAIIRVTGVPEGANVYAKKDSGAGVLEGMVLKNLYKGTAKVTVYVEYQGRTYTDQLYITALYDPYATLTVLDIGDATDPKKRLKLAIDVSGRLSWLLQ